MNPFAISALLLLLAISVESGNLRHFPPLDEAHQIKCSGQDDSLHQHLEAIRNLWNGLGDQPLAMVPLSPYQNANDQASKSPLMHSPHPTVPSAALHQYQYPLPPKRPFFPTLEKQPPSSFWSTIGLGNIFQGSSHHHREPEPVHANLEGAKDTPSSTTGVTFIVMPCLHNSSPLFDPNGRKNQTSQVTPANETSEKPIPQSKDKEEVPLVFSEIVPDPVPTSPSFIISDTTPTTNLPKGPPQDEKETDEPLVTGKIVSNSTGLRSGPSPYLTSNSSHLTNTLDVLAQLRDNPKLTKGQEEQLHKEDFVSASAIRKYSALMKEGTSPFFPTNSSKLSKGDKR